MSPPTPPDHSSEPSEPAEPGPPDRVERSEAEIDEDLEETFPSSDPPSTWAGADNK